MLRIAVVLRGRVLEEYRFDQDLVRIGRTPDNEVHLDNPVLSRRHAEIARVEGGWRLRDLDSTNGLLVNGKRLIRHALDDGDEIQLGKFVLTVSIPEGQRSAALEPNPVGNLADFQRQDSDQAYATTVVEHLIAEEATHVGRAYLAVRRGPQEGVFHLEQDCFHIGRSRGSELRLRGWLSPRRLAVIVRGLTGYSLVNVTSSGSGVLRNGKPVPVSAPLAHGDRLILGTVAATFRLLSA